MAELQMIICDIFIQSLVSKSWRILEILDSGTNKGLNLQTEKICAGGVRLALDSLNK